MYVSDVTQRLTLCAKSSMELIKIRRIFEGPMRAVEVVLIIETASAAACLSEGARRRPPVELVGSCWGAGTGVETAVFGVGRGPGVIL